MVDQLLLKMGMFSYLYLDKSVGEKMAKIDYLLSFLDMVSSELNLGGHVWARHEKLGKTLQQKWEVCAEAQKQRCVLCILLYLAEYTGLKVEKLQGATVGWTNQGIISIMWEFTYLSFKNKILILRTIGKYQTGLYAMSSSFAQFQTVWLLPLSTSLTTVESLYYLPFL